MKAVDTHQIIWLLPSKELSHIFGNQTYKITLYSSTIWREVAKDHWLLKGTLQRFKGCILPMDYMPTRRNGFFVGCGFWGSIFNIRHQWGRWVGQLRNNRDYEHYIT